MRRCVAHPVGWDRAATPPYVAVMQAAAFGSQLRMALNAPEMMALLAASPQAGRMLRPLCRVLAVELRSAQAEPRAEARDTGERPPRRRGTRPAPAAFRIALPRDVLNVPSYLQNGKRQQKGPPDIGRAALFHSACQPANQAAVAPASITAFTALTISVKLAGSSNAMAARTLRSSSMPVCLRPAMKRE